MVSLATVMWSRDCPPVALCPSVALWCRLQRELRTHVCFW